MKLIWAAAFFAQLGFGIYITTFNNFAVNSLHMSQTQLGLLESIRETPGFAVAFMLALAMHVAEPLLASSAMFLMALGFYGYSSHPSYVELVAFSLLWSIGLHCWMAIQPAMTLALAEEGHKGRRLGQVGAFGGLGTAVGIAAVLIIGNGVSFPGWYVVTAGTMLVSSVFVFFIRRDLSPPGKTGLVFKRKYAFYYALTFLEGCRKQVFITWAPFVLVKVYGTELRMVALLMLINNIVNVFGSPIVGKIVDRRGESRMLSVSYALLILVFIGYATVRQAPLLYVLYCLDNLLYFSSIGLTSYINRIAEKNDLRPSISMGVTTNHLGAVIVPILGGFLWVKSDYPIVFVLGAGVVAVSLVLAIMMKGRLRLDGNALPQK